MAQTREIKTDYNSYFNEWSAWNDNEVDYDWDGERYVGTLQIGYGKTEQEAINDLKQKTNEQNED